MLKPVEMQFNLAQIFLDAFALLDFKPYACPVFDKWLYVQCIYYMCMHVKTKQYLHTLMDMRTELTAVPHAGLGYQFLRVQVRKPEKEVEVHQVQRGHLI